MDYFEYLQHTQLISYVSLLYTYRKAKKSYYFFLLVVKDESDAGLFSLNIERLIYKYIQVYTAKDLYKALQYLCLLTLYSPKQGYTNSNMVDIAKSCICKFTMTNGDFKSLLGVLDNERKVNNNNAHVSMYIDIYISLDLLKLKPNF